MSILNYFFNLTRRGFPITPLTKGGPLPFLYFYPFLLFVILNFISVPSYSDNLSVKKSPAFHSQVIYGEDNRRDLFEVKDEDWLQRALAVALVIKKNRMEEANKGFFISKKSYGEKWRLCGDEAFFDQPVADGFCTAFLVEPDTVATAGHCISQESCAGVNFVFGFSLYSQEDSPVFIPKEDVYSCRDVVVSVNTTGEDFALVKLDREVKDIPPLELNAKKSLSKKTPLAVIGHPSGLPTKFSDGAFVRNIEKDYFQANLDTYRGNSGSPVFNLKTKKVEGVLVRGETDFRYDSSSNCYRSLICENKACRGEDATKVDSLLPFLEGA